MYGHHLVFNFASYHSKSFKFFKKYVILVGKTLYSKRIIPYHTGTYCSVEWMDASFFTVMIVFGTFYFEKALVNVELRTNQSDNCYLKLNFLFKKLEESSFLRFFCLNILIERQQPSTSCKKISMTDWEIDELEYQVQCTSHNFKLNG